MNKKQREVQQLFLDNEKEVLKKLESNYQDALSEINSKIELLLARQDADMQHVIYQVEYQRALKDQVSAILEQLHNNEFETVSEYLAQSYEDGFIGTMYDLQHQGIPLVIPIDQEQIVAAIQHETKLSESLYMALGKDTKDLSKKIAGEISRGISSGAMYSEIARNIASWGRIPKNNAMRIARTESHRIQIQATADAQWKAKANGADVVKQWDAALDKKTRKSHMELDGQIRELDEEFEANGHKAMFPGGFGRPEEDINCRCALLQRARWNLGSDYTKWSEDAPVKIADDGTSQLAKIEAKNYKEFKDKYKQASERVRPNVQKIKASKGLGNVNKMVYNAARLEETTDKWSKEAKEELLLDEKSLSARKKETACVYSGKGEFLFQKRGGEKEVQFTIKEFLKLKDTVITHNHPTGGSFTASDIYLLLASRASEVRASTENCVYYIRQPQKWDKAIKSKKQVEEEMAKIKEALKPKYMKLYKNGEITKTERFRMATDEVSAIFCEKFGIEYGKEYFGD